MARSTAPQPTHAPAPAGLSGLWQKWINVTTRPGVASFVNELPTANWRDIWLSLLGVGLLASVTGGIASLYNFVSFQIPNANGTVSTVRVPAAAGWGSIIGVLLVFFLVDGILFLSAKIFGGTGSFLEQSYAIMLYFVPIEGAIALPGLGVFVTGLLDLYAVVLAVFAIAASHRLSIGRSVGAVLLPLAVVLVLSCALIVALAAAIAATLNGAGH